MRNCAKSLRVELKRLHNDLGATFLFVTHDQVEAMSMGDKIAVLNKGKIVQVGTPKEIYDTPLNTFVARTVGTPPMNLIKGRLSGKKADMADAGIALPVQPPAGLKGADMIFGIRPENLVIESGGPAKAKNI